MLPRNGGKFALKSHSYRGFSPVTKHSLLCNCFKGFQAGAMRPLKTVKTVIIYLTHTLEHSGFSAPKGLRLKAQGCRFSATLGTNAIEHFNRKAVAPAFSFDPAHMTKPRCGWGISSHIPRVAEAATLGSEA